jgi:hypothetical protein
MGTASSSEKTVKDSYLMKNILELRDNIHIRENEEINFS